MDAFDVCVRGAGIVGQALALALSRQGLDVALQGRASDGNEIAREDVRAYALNAASVALLARLKVWDALSADARTPVYDMHIEGDAAASAIDFSAWQQRARELAWIVDAAALEAELANAVRFAPHITATTQPVAATLLAVTEGRDSASREQLGVTFQRSEYDQLGVAARLVASEPHRGVARQWFRSPDVLALLPFDRPTRARSWGLVWSMPTARAQELLALDDAGFESALNDATGGAAGRLELASARAAWPLALARANPVVGPGWALLGDAAHLVHPLAGQGLNLGLGDVVALARVIAEREAWRALGDERLLRRYERERALPVLAMGQLTDGLLRLFASRQPLVRELRNRGLTLVNHALPLKRWLAGQALDT
jgi:2-polyprenyl-6-methoxyphenol hydroxylase-like FAD-dependent oxidoreductase